MYWNAWTYLACVTDTVRVQCFVYGAGADTLGHKSPRAIGYKAGSANHASLLQGRRPTVKRPEVRSFDGKH
jgi:hypothetical protein